MSIEDPRQPDAPGEEREDPAWRASRSRRAQIALIGAVVPPLIGALGRTWTWRVHAREHLERADRGDRPPIFAFFHGRILPGTVFFRDRGIVVLTSENFDGEWIARVIRRFGYETSRGSTSRGAVRGLVQLRRDMKAGKPAAFTVDGPRGPVHRVQPGCIWLAKATGNPILPFHIESSAHWALRSWDRTQIPRPFSTVHVCIGQPLEIPADADDHEIERRRQALEDELYRLMRQATDLARSSKRGRR